MSDEGMSEMNLPAACMKGTLLALLIAGCDRRVERDQGEGADELIIYYRGIDEMSPARYSKYDLTRVARTKIRVRDLTSIGKVVDAIPLGCDADPEMTPDDLDYYILIVGEKGGERLFEFSASKFNFVSSSAAEKVCKLDKSQLIDLIQAIEGSQ